MFCENCGSKLPDNAMFCGECGAAVNTEEEPVQEYIPETLPQQEYTYGTLPTPEKKRSVWPIVVIVVALLLIAACAAVVAINILNIREDETAVTTEEKEEKDDPEDAEGTVNIKPEDDEDEYIKPEDDEPEVYPEPEFMNSTASDTLYEEGYSHAPENAFDGYSDTAWCVSDGVGEWIMLFDDDYQYVSGIRVLNGYNKYNYKTNTNLYYANSRPHEITIEFSDGTTIDAELEDIYSDDGDLYQELDFGRTIKTRSVKITANSVYSGTKWNDMCISEIQVY